MTADERFSLLRLLDVLPKRLGYNCIKMYHGANPVDADIWRCVFCGIPYGDYDYVKTDDGQNVCIDNEAADVYLAAAKKLYKILDRGESLHVKGQRLVASMVPEFMIECVLSGVAE